MTEPRTPLIREDYDQMQAVLEEVWRDATERAEADPLTLAHAIIPFAIERLLRFHDAATVQKICLGQIELIGALLERLCANREH